VVSFVFTADVHKPGINATITCHDPQNNVRKEQLKMALVDTPSGWLIDSLTTQEVN